MHYKPSNGHPFCTSGGSPKYKKNCASVLSPFSTPVLAFCLFRPLSVFFLPFLSVVKKILRLVLLPVVKKTLIFYHIPQTSVVLAMSLSLIQTSRYFEDFLVETHGRASFLISNIGCLGNVFIVNSNITLF